MKEEIKILKEQLENLKQIEEAHQKLNGELREEIKKLELRLKETEGNK